MPRADRWRQPAPRRRRWAAAPRSALAPTPPSHRAYSKSLVWDAVAALPLAGTVQHRCVLCAAAPANPSSATTAPRSEYAARGAMRAPQLAAGGQMQLLASRDTHLHE